MPSKEISTQSSEVSDYSNKEKGKQASKSRVKDLTRFLCCGAQSFQKTEKQLDQPASTSGVFEAGSLKEMNLHKINLEQSSNIKDLDKITAEQSFEIKELQSKNKWRESGNEHLIAQLAELLIKCKDSRAFVDMLKDQKVTNSDSELQIRMVQEIAQSARGEHALECAKALEARIPEKGIPVNVRIEMTKALKELCTGENIGKDALAKHVKDLVTMSVERFRHGNMETDELPLAQELSQTFKYLHDVYFGIRVSSNGEIRPDMQASTSGTSGLEDRMAVQEKTERAKEWLERQKALEGLAQVGDHGENQLDRQGSNKRYCTWLQKQTYLFDEIKKALEKENIEAYTVFDRTLGGLPEDQRELFLVIRGKQIEKVRKEGMLPITLWNHYAATVEIITNKSPEIKAEGRYTKEVCEMIIERRNEEKVKLNEGCSEYYMILGTEEVAERVCRFPKDCKIKAITIHEQRAISQQQQELPRPSYKITLEIDDGKESSAAADTLPVQLQ